MAQAQPGALVVSREKILNTLRAQSVPPAELPAIEGPWTTFRDRRGRFSRGVREAGGECVRVAGQDQLASALEDLECYANAQHRASVVPGWGDPNVSLGGLDDPRRLANVDFALLPGAIGVAENGAVWIDASEYLHRSVLFLPEHLGLVLSAADLVDHLHEAYDRIRFEGTGFGCFLAGPSKTADIEQSLVIGAHGARSLTVFLVESP